MPGSFLFYQRPKNVRKKFRNFNDFIPILTKYFFCNGHKNLQLGPGIVNNWPPGSIIQDYGSADPDENLIFY